MLQRYKQFAAALEEIKIKNPLSSANGYYPYKTLDVIPQILPILKQQKMDLEQYLVNKTILDLGCGDGDLSFFFETFGPEKVLAVDWGPTNYNNMEACPVLKRELRSKVHFINMDIHSFDFERLPRFDTVFCFGFLYHSPNPIWILEKLSKHTQHLFLTTKVFDSDRSYAYFYDIGECNNDPTNWWCFTPKALGLMLKRAGFDTFLLERLDSHVGASDPVDLRLDGRAFAYARSIAKSNAKRGPQSQ